MFGKSAKQNKRIVKTTVVCEMTESKMQSINQVFFDYFDAKLVRENIITAIDSAAFTLEPNILKIIFKPLEDKKLPKNSDSMDFLNIFDLNNPNLILTHELKWNIQEHISPSADLNLCERVYLSFLYFHCELQWAHIDESCFPSYEDDLKYESLPTLVCLVKLAADLQLLSKLKEYLQLQRQSIPNGSSFLNNSLIVALHVLEIFQNRNLIKLAAFIDFFPEYGNEEWFLSWKSVLVEHRLTN
jgi:hypothetical protein